VKSWVFILTGVIVALGLAEEVGGSIIEDLRTIGEVPEHFDTMLATRVIWLVMQLWCKSWLSHALGHVERAYGRLLRLMPVVAVDEHVDTPAHGHCVVELGVILGV